ncbi:unnamed protein product [Auanema sp. JU1783]|nr:unnamed protein product [Auanema sp. JU1783]
MADEQAYSDYFLDYKAIMEEVVLLEQPQSGFVIKSRPYHLSCKALNAKKIRFKCNNRWLDESRYESVLGTDPSSQLPYLESTIEINRQEVENVNEVKCQCYASGTSDDHVVRSDTAEIRVAFMRKHFTQTPLSERVAEGSSAQLFCGAPESEPKAQIAWLKDGQVLERYTDSHVIYGSDGSLIFSSVRLSDSGNYTCEASNVAHKRVTDAATLHVFVNGGWSEWSSYAGHCQVDCELLRYQLTASPSAEAIPHLRRTRTCNNPPPLNGGAYCSGNDEDLRQCEIPCRVNGGWSKWSEWSACTPTCHRFRSRTCTVPSPLNGGTSCPGRDLDTQPCSEGYCQPMTSTSDIALYGGITCVAILLFVIMALCSALVCKRNRGRKLNKNNANNIYYAESGAHVRRVLLDQKGGLIDDMHKLPHGSQFFTLASTCSPSPMHPSMTLRSEKSGYSGYSVNRNVGSRAALINECSSSNSSSGGGKRTLLRTSSNCSDDDDNYATLYDYCIDNYVE